MKPIDIQINAKDNSSKVFTQVVNALDSNVTDKAQDSGDALAALGEQFKDLQKLFVLVVGGGFAASRIKDVAQKAEECTNLADRVELATGAGEAFTALRQERSFLAIGAASELTRPKAMSRAVVLIELAEYLDGFGPTRPEGDA